MLRSLRWITFYFKWYKKYISFRESIPEINNNTIQFSYHFSQKENIRKINDKLNLINIGFVPSIDYDPDKKNLVIYLDKNRKQKIRVEVKKLVKLIKKRIKIYLIH